MNSNFFIKKTAFKEDTLDFFSLIIDVRSPTEFNLDSIPTSINLPVLTDSERDQVGKIYKKNKFQARIIGAKFVLKNINKIIGKKVLDKRKKVLIYCWRGGQRSLSLYLILKSIGFEVEILNEGYKGYRSFINNFFNIGINKYNFNILSGLTGSGKTYFLEKLSIHKPVLNLEKLANHKGSILGEIPNIAQPSQKKFETKIWFNLLKYNSNKKIWAESESNRIGKLFIPNNLYKKLTVGKILNLFIDTDVRANFILKDYKYLVTQTKYLGEALNILKKFIKKNDFEKIKKSLQRKEYFSFVRDLLINHYDKVYNNKKKYDEKNCLLDIKLGKINPNSFNEILSSINKKKEFNS